MPETRLSIGIIDPEILGTHGDNGNALVLRQRAHWRGLDPVIHRIGISEPVPSSFDIYLMGDGPDGTRVTVLEHLQRSRGLHRALRRGATLLAIGSSAEILGRQFVAADGQDHSGLDIVDIETSRLPSQVMREVVTKPLIPGLNELLSGHEQHDTAMKLGPDALPLGQVVYGTGNGYICNDDNESLQQVLPSATPFVRPQNEEQPVIYEGAVIDNIFCTYLHGPVLARNPEFADFILQTVLGVDQKLDDISEPIINRLRYEKLTAAGIDNNDM